MMRVYAITYLIALVVFLAIDFVWLSTVAKSFYVSELGPILRDSPNFVVAFLFYLIFVAGLVHFVIAPASGIGQAAITGAFFGFVAYATYDMTNLATIKGFTWRVAVVDMVWGAALSATVCASTVWLVKRFGLA